jgi:hypothetical protein
MVKNTGDHNASRLVKIQISNTILKFRYAAFAWSLQATSLRQQLFAEGEVIIGE